MQKKTFAETQAEIQALKNNSDLLNLANALEFIKLQRKDLDKFEETIMSLVKRIESDEVVAVGEISKIYDMVRSGPRSYL